jgi:hypothetical protein
VTLPIVERLGRVVADADAESFGDADKLYVTEDNHYLMIGDVREARDAIEQLYEALERILPYHGADESNADLDFARAALAKARGEQ